MLSETNFFVKPDEKVAIYCCQVCLFRRIRNLKEENFTFAQSIKEKEASGSWLKVYLNDISVCIILNLFQAE